MTLTITFLDGDTLQLEYVQGVEVLGPYTIDVWCFGNESVTHRKVRAFAMEPFDMTTGATTRVP